MGHDNLGDALPYRVSAEEMPSPTPLADYFAANEPSLRAALYKHGAILFRGFDIVDGAAFGAATTRMAGPLLDYRGGVARRRQLGDGVYNSTEMPADRTLAAHNEKSYSAAHPDLVLFCSVTVAATGGATPLADGRRVWQRLSTRLKDELRTRRITYIQNLHGGVGAGKSWMAAYETEDRAEVEALLTSIGARFRWKPDGTLHVEETVSPIKVHPVTGAEALFCPADTWYRSTSEFGGGRTGADRAAEEFPQYCRFEDGEEIAPWMVDEIRSTILAELREFAWRRGDVLLVDNRIALHGRASFTGDRLVLVAIAMDHQR
ncbi:SyrP [Rhodomicrobium udaipurense JA643]|uniref:TauD/TfdA family dioxygenase n=1 Tax=Rhodomicrobium udaipurense TaxID=1202716 RepID=A0A8I1GIR0_9HYPH|nr:TauD/TfdA family dioxygenase [Rhodomicrobium udaipurense]KAI96416.1 SyrP [Rhodomicrobium udaipurense JA643]MBJ7544550.1 TauD/TfdA family dioxygenase [Rhodomicrobium udaipurense]